LRQRQSKEEAAEQALFLAHSEYNKRQAVLEETKECLKQCLEVHESAGINVLEEMHISFYRQSLSERIARQEKEVSRAAMAVEDSRRKAVQARQDRQVIEKIREKQLYIHRREEEAKEQKLVDEMALYSHFRASK